MMTAKDLLYQILDYECHWSRHDAVQCKPAQIRLARIESLASAFGLTYQEKTGNPRQHKFTKSKLVEGLARALGIGKQENAERKVRTFDPVTSMQTVGYIVGGIFLRSPIEVAPSLKEKILEIRNRDVPRMKDEPFRIADVRWLFNTLWNYRKLTYQLTFPPEGMMEGYSAGLYYGYSLRHELNMVIDNSMALAHIDDILWTILDPSKRHLDAPPADYPDVNLDNIDHDWLMENY